MNLRIYLTLSLAAIAGLILPAGYAESYTETTTIERAPGAASEMREEIRTEETAPRTMVIREEPTAVIREAPTTIIKEEPVKEKVIVKKQDHHLIKVGPVKVF